MTITTLLPKKSVFLFQYTLNFDGCQYKAYSDFIRIFVFFSNNSSTLNSLQSVVSMSTFRACGRSRAGVVHVFERMFSASRHQVTHPPTSTLLPNPPSTSNHFSQSSSWKVHRFRHFYNVSIISHEYRYGRTQPLPTATKYIYIAP